LEQATIAIEDRRFYQHGALDYQGIVRAAIRDALHGGTSLQGASTLTMQLVDNVYLPERLKANHNLKYKIVQAKLAQQLEGRHHKNWILVNYLNDVPYGTVGGQTAYGVGAASRMFFDKPVSKLDLAQAALLAGLPQAPSQYNPFLDLAAARRRRMEVLQAMVGAGDITQARADAANREALQVRPDAALLARHDPYVFDYVQQTAARDLCPTHPNNCPELTSGALKIYATIDLRKQALAERAILAHEGGVGQPGSGLASVDPNNGHILAIASSGNYNQTKFDYATQAHRQPGSSFKIFVLMTLIHDNHGDPGQTYYNSHPLTAGWLPGYPSYSVHTAEGSYQGNINVTKATILSDNTVFAQLDADLGPDKVRQTAYNMGITSHLDGFPAEAIGGLRVGVTPLEMADAYATLANGGSHVPATIVNKIVFPDGSVRNFGRPTPKRVFTDGEASAATNVLKGVIQSGTGTAAGYGCPAAGKTGTAENYENAWFVGYTPRMATAVWVGYPQANIPMANGFGGTLAAPIWHDYMQAASGGYCGNFTPPTTSFSGTAYFGSHASTGSRSTLPHSRAGSQSGGAPTSPYNNPTLFAQPPQAPSGGGKTSGRSGGAGASGSHGGGVGAPSNNGLGSGPGRGGGNKP
ncbi:MAG: transglycosylase domain-containing protein, partial [Actinomycetota bacterium]|nr:transglycosylase domain-containing protein [Actinomycetota bacterium]